MFSGIIEEIGTIESLERSARSICLRIGSRKCVRELKVSDSIAVNGVCLTVINRSETGFTVDIVEETLKKTTCGLLRVGDKTNLELPLRINERLDGHMVLGHVDTVGEISRIEKRDNSWMYYVSYPKEFSKYIIPVGSVAIDGISLTVAEYNEPVIGFSIIPHTMEQTILQFKREESKVNIEFDMIGKYIVSFYERSVQSNPEAKLFLTEKYLRETGF